MTQKRARSQTSAEDNDAASAERPRCGMIRPIAAMDDYTVEHWREVHEIISEPVEDAGYDLKLVSESDNTTVIISEIVTNIYNNDLVIADVSGRNPNVMFELGMRMAFQKPVIIIVDDETPFSFDISPVKHLIYPKSLRFQRINQFKKDLSVNIRKILTPEGRDASVGYLKQFGRIEVSGLETQQIDANQIANDIAELKRSVGRVIARSDRADNEKDMTFMTSLWYPSAEQKGQASYPKLTVYTDQKYAEEIGKTLRIKFGTGYITQATSLAGKVVIYLLSKNIAINSSLLGRIREVVLEIDPDARVEFSVV